MKRPITLPAEWLSQGYALRPARARDRTFQRSVFAAARPDAAAIARTPMAQREAFLDSQFSLQDMHYRRFFAGAEYLIVTLHSVPVGRIVIQKSAKEGAKEGAKEWRLIDIGLMPEARGHGLGSALIVAVQAACAASRADVLHLQVESGNRARSLYERLGFTLTGDIGSHAPGSHAPGGHAPGGYAEMTWQTRPFAGHQASRQLKTAS